ncbi:MAG TPA: hypothetical protein VJ464_10780 [Blastocatellia bacterium]|nr:hypothetical protein [Blastocatellia bacterium]
MKARVYSTVLAIITFAFVSVVSAMAQHEHQHGGQKPPAQSGKPADMSAMMNGPHHLLAMAYARNISSFAAVLHEQAGKSNSVDADLARAATAEIRRSFDAMQQHMQEHMNGMGGDMQSHLSMMQGADAHVTAIKQHLTALERDVQADTLNARSIADHAAEIHKHADEMAGAQSGHEHKM